MQNEAGYVEVAVQRYKDNVLCHATDVVATEVPVALVFNGISHAVMLATPLNLVDFAVGFSFSEGIIDHFSEIYDIDEVIHPELGIEVHITIANANFMRLKKRRRSLAGQTGCGLCGLDSLSAFDASTKQINPATAKEQVIIHHHALLKAFKHLQPMQPLNKLTGAVHAAAWINAQGDLLLVREDVGRHNALDKLIGALLKQPDWRDESHNGCVIMTSRASYELVQKTARAGISLLATISAPTGLAIHLAEKSALTLVGFVRGDSLVAYSQVERVRFD